MTPLVVAQNNFVQRLTGPLAERVREMGIALHDVSSGDMEGIPATPPGGPWGPILVVGSVLFVHQWARGDAELAKWVFWDDARYDAMLWARVLGDRFMNHRGHATTIGGFVASVSGAMHLRPRSGMKMVGERIRTESQTGLESVPGILATPSEIAARRIDADTPVWASPAVDIHAEIRVWMIAGRPEAASTYRVEGAHVRDSRHPLLSDAVAQAVETHAVWSPDRHYVVDMALTPEGWKVIEYNPIHSSGWYDADPGVVVEAFFGSEGVAV